MIEYVILGVAAAIFLLVLAGLALSALLRIISTPRRPALPSSVPGPVPIPPGGVDTARTLLDAMTEVMRDAAAAELVKAMTLPENNPHIPSFLTKSAAPKPTEASVPNA